MYPQQVVLLPGDEVVVQVRWIGDPALPAERAYAMVAREVHIAPQTPPPEVTSGVRIEVNVLLNYEVRLYVAPPGAAPKLAVDTVEELPAQGPGGPRLRVLLANEGNGHEDLQKWSLLLMPLDAQGRPLPQQGVRVPVRDIPGTRPHLLAGDRRQLLVPRPGALPAGRIHVQLVP